MVAAKSCGKMDWVPPGDTSGGGGGTTSREEEIKIKVVGLLKMVADTMGCTHQDMLKILTLAVAAAGKTRTRMPLVVVVVVVVVETIMAMWARKAGEEVGI